MAGINLTHDVRQLRLPEEKLALLAHVNTQPLMEEIGEYILNATLINFEQEQTPEGEPWKPSQRAQAEGGKTLTDRGHLRDSYTYSASASGVEVGSNLIYAAIHHEGGKAGRNLSVDLPARTALGLTDDDENEVGEMALAYYYEVLQ